MSTLTTRRLAASGMAGAALLAIAGFTALGSIFDYPKILKEPTDHLLEAFRENQTAVTSWFLVLVISAALLAPVGILLGRIAGGTRGRWIAGVGITAASVQVIGLSRWVLLIPGVSDAVDQRATVAGHTEDAHRTFESLHFWLGTVIGETIGYALTATFTVLVVMSLTRPAPRAVAPRWIGYLGYAAAALIATGVLVPFGADPATMTNFIGYVAWCVWLIVMAVVLWRPRAAAGESTPAVTDGKAVATGS